MAEARQQLCRCEEVPEAQQYGSKHKLSSVTKVEPEARQHGSKQAAFTLAEVLITLGIIGIVAAMTIPTLMKNYQKRVTLTQLKQTYSMLSQAVKMSTIDNGEITQWNIPNSSDYATTDAFVSTYFLPYLKNVHKCDWSVKECEPSAIIGLNNSTGHWARRGLNYYVLSNGVTIYIWPRGTVVEMGILAQGYQKRAMTGKNVFHLILAKGPGNSSVFGNFTKEGLYFYGEGLSRETLTSQDYSACNTKKSGVQCGALIKLDGWQINYDF